MSLKVPPLPPHRRSGAPPRDHGNRRLIARVHVLDTYTHALLECMSCTHIQRRLLESIHTHESIAASLGPASVYVYWGKGRGGLVYLYV